MASRKPVNSSKSPRGNLKIKETDVTVPVKRDHRSAAERKPIPPEAIDRRSDVAGADESHRSPGESR